MTSGASEITVRKARSEDLDAIKRLADAYRHELGFVRRPALAGAIERGEVIVAQNCEGIVGFVEYRHRRDEQTTIYHIGVGQTYHGRGVGRALIVALRAEAKTRGKRVMRVKCPVDLPANAFYQHLGCQLEDKEMGKQRALAIWSLYV